MQDLIEKLEKAAEPYRGLDGRIHIAVFGESGFEKAYQLTIFSDNLDKWCERGEIHQVANNYGIPPYTSSIDAALTLVPPEPWLRPWDISSRGDRWEATVGAGFHPRDVGYESRATSRACPAIALCIAALKARLAIASHKPQQGQTP